MRERRINCGRSIRMEIKALDEIDGEVKKWLKTAYELDGK